MATSRDIICSKDSSMSEICGTNATYFNPKNPNELVKKINLIKKNKKNHPKSVREHLRNFNLKTQAKKLYLILNKYY